MRHKSSAHKKVSKPQLSKIWANARDLGMVGEQKYQLYGLASKVAGRFIESFSDEVEGLNFYEAFKLIRKLEQLNSPSKAKRGGNVIQLTTKEQKEKAYNLEAKINEGSKKVDINTMSLRMYKREFEKLTLKQTQFVIEALKSILKRFEENRKKRESKGTQEKT